MGRAAAVAAAPGRRIAISGRRQDKLEETAQLIRNAGGEVLVAPLDVTAPGETIRVRDAIRSAWGGINDLILAAGLNTPNRAWSNQKLTEFDDLVSTNLVAPVRMIDASLADMRKGGGGQIVLISSYAGWTFSPNAGVAYSATKTALSSLSRTLNTQEARHAIRSCHLCPGDVDSDFLQLRPEVPDAQARAVMLRPEDVARAVQFVLDSPPHVRIDELVISPVSQT